MKQQVNIHFPKGEKPEFYQVLRTRVQAYFDQNGISKYGNSFLFWKAAILYTIYVGSFALILTNAVPGWSMLLLSVVMGIVAAGLGMSVMHDALHHAFSSKKWINQLMSNTMEFLGGSSFTWKVQHNNLHHTYTNVYELDEDIQDKTLLRFSPEGKWYPIQRFQHIYAPILYALSTLSWVSSKDFRQLVRYNRDGYVKKMGTSFGKELFKLTANKVLYWFVFLALPIILLPYAWYWVVIGFVLMHAVNGFILTLVFVLAHAVEDAKHLQADEKGSLENNWAVHQLLTTANFKVKNPIFATYFGGLDHQVEHHLFTGISHIHYRKLSDIVRQTAKDFSLPYYENPTLGTAIVSHFRFLKQLGQKQVS